MPSIDIDLTWNVNYLTRPAENPKRLVLLLHGYQQNAATILKLLGGCFDADSLVVAPDGLFPVPYRAGKNYRMGYAWYFFDPATGVYGVPMDTARRVLTALVGRLASAHLPKWVVGYSQGGYLAPFAAMDLDGAERVIGVNSRYRHEVLDKPLPFRLDALHGALDPMVDPEGARRSHEAVMAAGNEGDFVMLPGSAHQIDEPLRQALETMTHQGAQSCTCPGSFYRKTET